VFSESLRAVLCLVGTGRKLFVGRISRHLTETDLVATFASFGHIDDCAIIRHPCTGLSAGCAFVTFADSASASAAINCLHRSQLAFVSRFGSFIITITTIIIIITRSVLKELKSPKRTYFAILGNSGKKFWSQMLMQIITQIYSLCIRPNISLNM